jgi:hypothetical protein
MQKAEIAMMEHTRTPHQYHYRAPRERNDMVGLSLFCAALWPLLILIPFVVYLLAFNHPGPTTQTVPAPLWALYGFAFFALPVTGVIAGGVGLYRALHEPLLRKSRWWAVVGLLLSCLWLVGYFFF